MTYKVPRSAALKPRVISLELPVRALCISDLHCPYHDEKALRVALDYGLDEKCDVVVILGDLVDFYEISSFAKKEDRMTLREELECAVEMLSLMRSLFPKAKIFYVEGNHETRYSRYIYQQARALALDPYFSLQARLYLDRMNINYVSEYHSIRIGKLYLEHGHFLTRGVYSPVSPARTALLRTIRPVLIGHHHRSSEHQKTDIKGSLSAAWTMGCLCELRPPYSPHSEWNHGFAFVSAENHNIFHLRNLKMYKYQIL